MMKEKTYEKKASTKNGILRLVFVALAIILETLFFWGIFFTRLQNYISIITIANFVVSREVTEKYKTGIAMPLRLGQLILRLMAPLL